MKKNNIKKYISLLVLILFTFSLSYSTSIILKNVLKIRRPCISLAFCPNDYSFPSLNAVVLFSLTSVLFFEKRKWNLHIVLLIVSIVVSSYEVIILVSRPIDILSGIFIGFLTGYIVHKIIRFLGKD